MLAEQFERISRVSCVTSLAQQQAEPLCSLQGAAPTAREAPCPQHGVITSEISNPFLFVIVNLKIFCLFSLGNSPSRSPGCGVSLLSVLEHGADDPRQDSREQGCVHGPAPPAVSMPLFPRCDARSWARLRLAAERAPGAPGLVTVLQRGAQSGVGACSPMVGCSPVLE